ncbi:MAG: tRNA guanosine(15) transglycosylase TgtA [Thermoplasmatota archaeon]
MKEEDLHRTGFNFEIKEMDLAGRTGELSLNGKKVTTPELMPVVNPNKYLKGEAVSPGELRDRFGFGMIITNSFIIRNTPQLREKIGDRGLHSFLDFPGLIMTDSGTFQSYVYGDGGEVDVDPTEIVSFQKGIGSDIGTILDRFTVPDRDHQGALDDLGTTIQRAKDSIELGLDMELAVPVQGGRHLDLRRRSGRAVKDLGVRYAPIGGVVPIMESYDYPLLVDVIVSSKMGLGPSIPTHLFGAGHPMLLPLATALGCDLFDSASYAKFARDGRYMTEFRTYHLKEMDILPCSCPACSGKDPADLLCLPEKERYMLLSEHNLWTLRRVLDNIRASIREGTLWEVIERSAMSNPQMYSAVRGLRKHSKFLEENAPRTTRRFSCCSGLSLARPEFQRYREMILHRYLPPKHEKSIILTDWTMSHDRRVVHYFDEIRSEGLLPLVRSPLGPIPYALIDMYPLSQSIFPPPGSLDADLEEHLKDVESEMLGKHDLGPGEWNGLDPLDISERQSQRDPQDIEKVRKMIDMQIPLQSDERPSSLIIPNDGTLRMIRSRRTGRIRNVMEVSGEEKTHLLSIRADDGHLNLKAEAARRLHKGSRPLDQRVVVQEETAVYNAKGYNVFCKFVEDAHPGIRPGDEVLVVDASDELYAVGVAKVSCRMMLEADSGIAVKVREGTRPDIP